MPSVKPAACTAAWALTGRLDTWVFSTLLALAALRRFVGLEPIDEGFVAIGTMIAPFVVLHGPVGRHQALAKPAGRMDAGTDCRSRRANWGG